MKPCPNCQGINIYQYRRHDTDMLACRDCHLIKTVEAWDGGHDVDSTFSPGIKLINRIRVLEYAVNELECEIAFLKDQYEPQ